MDTPLRVQPSYLTTIQSFIPHRHIHKKTQLKTEVLTTELTSESAVDSLDSSVRQRAASLLKHYTAGCDLGPVLSNGRGRTVELRPQCHSDSLLFHSQEFCQDKTVKIVNREKTLYLLNKSQCHSFQKLSINVGTNMSKNDQ